MKTLLLIAVIAIGAFFAGFNTGTEPTHQCVERYRVSIDNDFTDTGVENATDDLLECINEF